MTFEIFRAPCYFDMWGVRSTADKDFNMTIHLSKQAGAEHAKYVIEEWVKQGQREILLEAAEAVSHQNFRNGNPWASETIRLMAEEIK